MTSPKIIPYGKQDINKNDIDSVIDVLKSNNLTQGPLVPKFEKSLSIYTGSRFCTLVNSATSALHIACLALGVTKGDYVWTSANTFVASANCARLCGANVDFVDIDELTFNLSEKTLEDKLKVSKKEGKLPKVVIPVHIAGQSCDMKRIFELSIEYGFKIIEDASHALGGDYLNTKIGSCKYSDITVFSFHPIKMITTGEGGAVMTNSETINRNLTIFRTHGITSNKNYFEKRPDNELWNYQQLELGLNYRMTEIQAALGLSQLNRLDKFVSKRRSIANTYNALFKGTKIKTPIVKNYSKSSFHLYIIQWELLNNNKSNKYFFRELQKKGIMVNYHYIPVYLQPYYLNQGFKKGYCPNSESYFQKSLSIPIFTQITDKEIKRVAKEIISIIA